MRGRLLALLILAFVVGCAPKLDTSSEEAMKKSMETMSAKLSDEEKKELSAAMAAILFSTMFSGEGGDGKDALKELHGLTAKEIIAKGKAKAAEVDKKLKLPD